jgi:hypothetical protein
MLLHPLIILPQMLVASIDHEEAATCYPLLFLPMLVQSQPVHADRQSLLPTTDTLEVIQLI